MRRYAILAAIAFLLLPAGAQGQLRFLAGAGFTNPMSDLNDVADVGWNALGGIQLNVTSIPIGFRADGGYHSFGEQSPNPKASILSGALSVVVTFPGIGLSPYVLGGVGQYRYSVDVDGVDPTSDMGIHGAFGVDIGSLGFGGFAEVRLVNVKSDGSTLRYVAAVLGIRL